MKGIWLALAFGVALVCALPGGASAQAVGRASARRMSARRKPGRRTSRAGSRRPSPSRCCPSMPRCCWTANRSVRGANWWLSRFQWVLDGIRSRSALLGTTRTPAGSSPISTAPPTCSWSRWCPFAELIPQPPDPMARGFVPRVRAWRARPPIDGGRQRLAKNEAGRERAHHAQRPEGIERRKAPGPQHQTADCAAQRAHQPHRQVRHALNRRSLGRRQRVSHRECPLASVSASVTGVSTRRDSACHCAMAAAGSSSELHRSVRGGNVSAMCVPGAPG